MIILTNNIKQALWLGWRKQGVLYQSLSVFALVLVFGVYLTLPGAATMPLWLVMSWLGISFAALYGQEWWFDEELQQGTLEIMQTRPLLLGGWVVAKYLAFLCCVMLPMGLVAWLIAWGAGHENMPGLATSYALAIVALGAFACLGAALTCAISQRGSISYCLLLPMMLPISIMGLLSAHNTQMLVGLAAYTALILPISIGLSIMLVHHAASQE
ncbi:hypothetical protein GC177_09025 [bacterium]|nr:hypothetical protein [bacterium]